MSTHICVVRLRTSRGADCECGIAKRVTELPRGRARVIPLIFIDLFLSAVFLETS